MIHLEPPSNVNIMNHHTLSTGISPKGNLPRHCAQKYQLTVTKIVGGLLGSLGFVVGHHLYLQQLDGREVSQYSQTWTKAANNALAHGVALLLVIAGTTALTQVVSDYLRITAP